MVLIKSSVLHINIIAVGQSQCLHIYTAVYSTDSPPVNPAFMSYLWKDKYTGIARSHKKELHLCSALGIASDTQETTVFGNESFWNAQCFKRNRRSCRFKNHCFLRNVRSHRIFSISWHFLWLPSKWITSLRIVTPFCRSSHDNNPWKPPFDNRRHDILPNGYHDIQLRNKWKQFNSTLDICMKLLSRRE